MSFNTTHPHGNSLARCDVGKRGWGWWLWRAGCLLLLMPFCQPALRRACRCLTWRLPLGCGSCDTALGGCASSPPRAQQQARQACPHRHTHEGTSKARGAASRAQPGGQGPSRRWVGRATSLACGWRWLVCLLSVSLLACLPSTHPGWLGVSPSSDHPPRQHHPTNTKQRQRTPNTARQRAVSEQGGVE